MTTKTHTTAVVLIPPETIWGPIQAIRRRHDRHFARWMPHVTLLYPFWPRARFDAAEGKLREACRRLEPFEANLLEFNHFSHGRGRYTVWLAPAPPDAVRELQSAVESALPDCNDVSRYGAGFTPHLSVGQMRGDDAMAALAAELQASWSPLSFTARQISLIWRNDLPDDVFRVDRHIQLGP